MEAVRVTVGPWRKRRSPTVAPTAAGPPPKWVGQCRECGAWGTVDQAGEVTGGQRAAATPPRRPALPIGDVDGERASSRSTGVGELDRVLGGGIVPGAVILLAGEPGVGKSTLLLDVAAKAARTAASSGRGPVLYVTGEESAAQVRGAPNASERSSRTCSSPMRRNSASSWGTSRPRLRPCSSSTPCRQSPPPRSKAGRAASPRCARSPPHSFGSPKNPTYPPCSSAT